jgi:hypothetical protein
VLGAIWGSNQDFDILEILQPLIYEFMKIRPFPESLSSSTAAAPTMKCYEELKPMLPMR